MPYFADDNSVIITHAVPEVHIRIWCWNCIFSHLTNLFPLQQKIELAEGTKLDSFKAVSVMG